MCDISKLFNYSLSECLLFEDISASGECFCISDCHLQFTTLDFISSVVAFCISSYASFYASFYAGFSCYDYDGDTVKSS